MNMTQKKKPQLYQLVWDCEQYGLSEDESLVYIKHRYDKKIGRRQFYRYKKEIDSGEYTLQWLSDFTRVGFVISHQDLINNTKKLLKSSNRRLLKEEQKQNPDEQLIIKLKEDIRQSLKLLEGFNLGTPVISAIRAQLQNELRESPEQPRDIIPEIE